MSSLTTSAGSISVAAEECYSAEEIDDTRLSLEVGGTRRPRSPPRGRAAVQLFGELLTTAAQDHGRRHRDPAPASGKKRGSGAVAAAASRQESKKARSTLIQDEDGHRWSQSENGGGGGGSRKKLRLTAVQATLLEDSFRAHNILSHGEKQELARRVGLSARQVEVWFQNRRARTKLKQTEVDCELLRRWCDRLTDENARLRHDLAGLRSAAAAAVGGAVVCPSCRDRKIPIVGNMA